MLTRLGVFELDAAIDLQIRLLECEVLRDLGQRLRRRAVVERLAPAVRAVDDDRPDLRGVLDLRELDAAVDRGWC
ncbi:hypothetical protein HR12_42285 [Microbacterium sp. SUBG005]|nr:hypothetical protein HR12_42285 [Microbacterium sp. SUBG005]